jgi:hypothetical protein
VLDDGGGKKSVKLGDGRQRREVSEALFQLECRL